MHSTSNTADILPIEPGFTVPSSIREQLVETAYHFAEAEALLKRVERITCELPTTLINELRYAGSHLSRYILEHDVTKISHEIQKAKGHCERVKFDAYEIMLNYYLDNFIQFFDQFAGTTIPLSEIIPGYLESKKVIREARDFVEEHTSKEERVQYSIHAKGYLEELKPLWDVYDDAREEIWKRVQNKRYKVLLTVGGILLAMTGIAVCTIELLTN